MKTRFLKTIGFLFLFVFISIGMKLNCSGAEPVPTIEALSNKVAHLEENVAAADLKIGPDEWEEIEAATKQ